MKSSNYYQSMMILDSQSILFEAMQNCHIDLNVDFVLPKCVFLGDIISQASSNFLKNVEIHKCQIIWGKKSYAYIKEVVTMNVKEICSGNFRNSIPTIERTSWKLNTPYFHQHTRNSRYGIPLKFQIRELWNSWMTNLVTKNFKKKSKYKSMIVDNYT